VAATATLLLVASLTGARANELLAPAPRDVYLPDVLPRLDLATNLGPAAPATPLNLVVALAHPDPDGEQAAYAAMYDPAGPGYHRFLTPAAYAARFGVPVAEVQGAEQWLRAGGLGIAQVSSPGDLIQATGTVAQAERLFRSPIDDFSFQGAHFLANTLAPAVPDGLPVTAVVGLNTLQQFQPATPRPAAASPAAAGAHTAPHSGAAAGTYNGTFTERDLWKIYDLPDTNYGNGEAVGVFGEGDTDPIIANLRVFEQRQGLPQVPVRVVRTERGTFGDVSGGDEWNLDSQASTGMAPMASQLVYYFANQLYDPDVLTAFSKWAGDPTGPLQASASFGECEADPLNSVVGSPLLDPEVPFGQGLGDNLEAAAEPILRQATLEGRTLFASTGDTGALCPAVALPVVGPANGVLPGTAPFQNYPAVSQYAVSVGGTTVTSDSTRSKRVDETAWTYGGGGPSAFVAEPSFQKGIAAIDRACPVGPAGQAYPSGTVCRGVPDISDDSSGGIPGVQATASYDVVEDMVDTPVGGTSLSAPLADGMWARIQAAAPPGGLGFAAESLYRIAKGPRYHDDFYDVTASEFGAGNFVYQPGPGYDYASGLGVMDVAHLMSDLTGRLTPTRPVPPPPVPAPAVVGDCRPAFTSPEGNAGDVVTEQNDPALDFTGGRLARSADGKSLVVTMTGPGLSPGAAPGYLGGTTYTVYWTSGGKTWFAEAQVGPPGVVSYADGHVDPSSPEPVVGNTISGTFTTGRLQMTVPLADVGNPAAGTVLHYPYGAVSGAVTGVPGVVGVLPVTVDAGSNFDYQVGLHC
jgi:pseudomonalisin